MKLIHTLPLLLLMSCEQETNICEKPALVIDTETEIYHVIDYPYNCDTNEIFPYKNYEFVKWYPQN